MAQILPLSDGNDIPQCFLVLLGALHRKLPKERSRSSEAGVRHFEIAELFGNGHIIVQLLVSCVQGRICISLIDLAQGAHSGGYGVHRSWTDKGHGLELR